jgi:hypothetical protein
MHSTYSSMWFVKYPNKSPEVKNGWPQYGMQYTSGRESEVRTTGSTKPLVFIETPASVLLRPS